MSVKLPVPRIMIWRISTGGAAVLHYLYAGGFTDEQLGRVGGIYRTGFFYGYHVKAPTTSFFGRNHSR